MTPQVKKILSYYESDTPGIKANLARMLNSGHLSGTGRMIILPVDQGFEHGPDRSFMSNMPSYDPHYHFQLAIEAGLSAYAAPLGMLEAGADTFAGQIPTILKINSANSLYQDKEAPVQATTATVHDAVRLGCSAVGLTIYPGSGASYDQLEQAKEIIAEARAYSLPTVVWSYPRGKLSKPGETALDVIAYGAHMAALLGAHIIKVKLPSDFIEVDAARTVFEKHHQDSKPDLKDRVAHVMRCCFNGRRIVVFSGGETKETSNVFDDARAIHAGGGNGSIIGRNSFQRSKSDALDMLGQLTKIYRENIA